MLKPGILACGEPQLCGEKAPWYAVNVGANYLVPLLRTFLIFEAVTLEAELRMSIDGNANRAGERGVRANSGSGL
jgi:hypothetical protein